MRRLLSCFNRLWFDRRGNIAILFGLAIIPVFGAMGVAVDYSLANASRTALQASLDNTGLMLAKMMPLSDANLNAKGWQIFQGNLGNSPLVFQQSNLVIVQTTTTLKLDINTIYNTQLASILKLVGANTAFPVGAHTQVSWGQSRLRIALVLDNTGSMSSAGKIGALQTATTNLINQLKGIVVNPGDVYISIIPFVRDVNVGPSNYNAALMADANAWTAWETPPPSSTPSATVGPGSSCPYTSGTPYRCAPTPTNNPNCNVGSNNACVGTIPSSGTYKGYICPSYDSSTTVQGGIYYNGCYTSVQKPSQVVGIGSSASCSGFTNCTCSGSGSNKICTQTFPGQYNHPWTVNAHSTWNGCMMDRGVSTLPGTSADYDQNIIAPAAGVAASQFPAQQYYFCPAQQVIGLTYDWTALNNAVSGMSPNGSTNQPIGLVWGWQSLVGGGPFPLAPVKDPSYTYNQYIILLSDGLNTQDRWYGDGSTTNTNVDNRMYYGAPVSGTCKNIKDAGIKIFTVQVNTGGDPTSTLLQNCASDPSMFFMLTSSSQIVSTFQQIGTALANLHLSM
jgi:Flp pilus assembly protein TadG